jgi:hypothetical protein
VEITENKVTNLKTVLGSCPGEDVGFRDNFTYDIQRYISNDQAYGKLSGNKDWQKNVSIFQISRSNTAGALLMLLKMKLPREYLIGYFSHFSAA